MVGVEEVLKEVLQWKRGLPLQQLLYQPQTPQQTPLLQCLRLQQEQQQRHHLPPSRPPQSMVCTFKTAPSVNPQLQASRWESCQGTSSQTAGVQRGSTGEAAAAAAAVHITAGREPAGCAAAAAAAASCRDAAVSASPWPPGFCPLGSPSPPTFNLHSPRATESPAAPATCLYCPCPCPCCSSSTSTHSNLPHLCRTPHCCRWDRKLVLVICLMMAVLIGLQWPCCCSMRQHTSCLTGSLWVRLHGTSPLLRRPRCSCLQHWKLWSMSLQTASAWPCRPTSGSHCTLR
mmetsp:Transcript_22418/g.58525  ORF Transcript_22418/g.58525 Transcript_22418/m.58525 type:complete len:288 (+) Transcript_22418:2062-2925(+)